MPMRTGQAKTPTKDLAELGEGFAQLYTRRGEPRTALSPPATVLLRLEGGHIAALASGTFACQAVISASLWCTTQRSC